MFSVLSVFKSNAYCLILQRIVVYIVLGRGNFVEIKYY